MFTKETQYTEVNPFNVVDDAGVVISPRVTDNELQDFQTNVCGWIMNDISALNGAKSLQEYEVIAARLREYEASNPDTSKMSTAELIQSVAPHSFQTPSEVEQFARVYGSYLQSRYQEVYDKKLAEIEAKRVAQSAQLTQKVEFTEPQTT